MVKTEDGQIEVDILMNPGEKVRIVAKTVGDEDYFVDLHMTFEEFKELIDQVLD